MAKCYYCKQEKKTRFHGLCCSECYNSVEALPVGLMVFFLRNIRRPDGKYDSITDTGVITQVTKLFYPNKTGIYRYRVTNGLQEYIVNANNISPNLHDIQEKSRLINIHRRRVRDLQLENIF